jgi:hypothetical protein
MRETRKYVLIGFMIFVFVCTLTVLITWCGHYKELDENGYQLHPYHTSVVSNAASTNA